MPHGDMSDWCGVALIAAGGQLLMYPGVVASSEWIYPRATHDAKELTDPSHVKILSLVAAFEIMLGCILITVRMWKHATARMARCRAYGPLSSSLSQLYSMNDRYFMLVIPLAIVASVATFPC